MRTVHLFAVVLVAGSLTGLANAQASASAQSGTPAQNDNPLGKPDIPPRQEGRRGQGAGRGMGQGMGQGMGMMMNREGTAGTIEAINGGDLTVKSTAGKSVTVKTSDETRVFSRERGQLAIKDLKLGDAIAAGGKPDGDVVQARGIMLLDSGSLKRLQEMQANLGKTYITGEIKEINDTKLTILRPDGQTQVIDLDENTSLKKGGESVTLADVKVGDRVMGQGELKDGFFVPRDLRIMTPGQGRMRMEQKQENKPQ